MRVVFYRAIGAYPLHCDRDSPVFSFLLPRGHQMRQDNDESDSWEPQESEAIIYYITHIPESVRV